MGQMELCSKSFALRVYLGGPWRERVEALSVCQEAEQLGWVEPGDAWHPLLVHGFLQLLLHFSEVHVIILCVIHGDTGA